MKHLKTFESYNGIETKISEKTEENLNFLKSHFTDLPLTIEQYKERPHIFCCESRYNGELVGSAIYVIRDFEPNGNEINIPVNIDYKLPRVHINYIRTLEEFRGKGIGKDIVRKIVEWSKLNGVGIITANVKLDNMESQRLFTSYGFTKSGGLTATGSNTFYLIV